MKRIRSTAEERARQLGRCDIMSILPAADLRALAGFAMLREYASGELQFLQGQHAEGFYVIVSGKAKICRYGGDGREQVLHIFGPGDPCGEVPMFQGGNFPASAVADGKLRALYLPRDKFVELGKRMPMLLMKMLAVLSTRLRHFVQLVEDLSLKEVSARLAKHLLDLSARSDGADEVELGTTKATLASRLGTIAETLSRTLSKMQRNGIIRVSGRRIAILDARALGRLAAGAKL